MQCPLVSDPIASDQAQSKPVLASYDSSQECSLSHWMELILLVEREDGELKGYLLDDTCLRVAE